MLFDWADRKAESRLQVAIQGQVTTLDRVPPPALRQGPVVVIVGTSLIHAALQMAGTPLDKFPASMKLVVLSGDNRKAEWFDGLVPALRRAHPDLILFEPRVLFAIGQEPGLPGRVHNLLLAILPPGHWKGPPPVCQGLILRRSPAVAGTGKVYQWVYDPARLRLDRLPVLESLRAEGIEVGVLDLPRARELEAAAPNMALWHIELTKRLMAKGFSLWSPPGEWPAVDFCDMAHLNHAGALLFDDWLSAQLKQKFALTP